VTARQHLHDGIVSDRGQYPGGEVGQNTVLIGHGYNITGAPRWRTAGSNL